MFYLERKVFMDSYVYVESCSYPFQERIDNVLFHPAANNVCNFAMLFILCLLYQHGILAFPFVNQLTGQLCKLLI